jgi:pilus assembly protein CpaB
MRTMTFRALIFLVAAIVLAILSGTVVYTATQQAGAKAAAAPPPAVATVEVVVAASDVPVRTVITAEMLTTRVYPAQLAPSGSLTRTTEAVGQTTAASVYKGQPIVRAQLGTAGRAVSTAIERGKVLVAFPTGDPLTAAGLINVGDHVDILASVLQGGGENAKVSQTTLQNLEVLDILSPTKEQPARATSLVFSVDHQVAIVMKYLRDSAATVDIVIRSRAEDELVRTSGVDLAYVVGTYGFRTGGPR